MTIRVRFTSPPLARAPDGFRTERLDLKVRELHPGQVFSHGGAVVQESVETIKEAIRRGGAMPPLTARATEIAGRYIYTLRDGHHRLEALRQLGYRGPVPTDVWFEEAKGRVAAARVVTRYLMAANSGVKVIRFARLMEDDLTEWGTELFHVEREGVHYLIHRKLGGHINFGLLTRGSKPQVARAFDSEVRALESGAAHSNPHHVVTETLDAGGREALAWFDDPKFGIKWEKPLSGEHDVERYEQDEFYKLLKRQLSEWVGAGIHMPVTSHPYWPTFQAMVIEAVTSEYGGKVRLWRGVSGRLAVQVLQGGPFHTHDYASWTVDKGYAKEFIFFDPGSGVMGRGKGNDYWVVVETAYMAKSVALAPVKLPGFAPDPDILYKALGRESEFVIYDPRKYLKPGQFKVAARTRKPLPEERVRLARATHYKLDQRDARRWTTRDREAERDYARHYGYYQYHELEIVPLRDIAGRPVWREDRIAKIREAIAEGKPLPAIWADPDSSGKYVIGDGIHRYNASLEAGFTHIPVITTVTVEAPEMRVAARYLRAGLFQAPPAMLAEIGQWISREYASRVLAQVRDRRGERGEERQRADKFLKWFPTALRENTAFSFQVDTKVGLFWHGVKYVSESKHGPHYLYGWSRSGPDRMQWSRKRLSMDEAIRVLTDKVDEALQGLPREHAELDKALRAACKKYTSRAAPTGEPFRTSMDVDVNLDGWRYLDDIDLPGWQVKLRLSQERLTTISVVFDMLSPTDTVKGRWEPKHRRLTIYGHGTKVRAPRTPEQFKDAVAELLDTLRHELQHVAQDILGTLANLGEKAGLPPERLQHPEEQHAGTPHALRDLEFQTDLADAVDGFERKVRRMPREQRRQALRDFVGLGKSSADSEHFHVWKTKDPAKWRQAVKTLVAEVGRRGIDIPPEPGASRVAGLYLASGPDWTVPFLEKLIEASEGMPELGSETPGRQALRAMIRSVGFGNLDPYPVDDLWEYLEYKGAWPEEIEAWKRLRVPRERKPRQGPDVYEASRDLDRLTSASIVYRGLDLGSRDPDVVKAIQAYTRAIAKLPPLARRVWDRTVKKLILADTGRSADASWLGGGRMELNLRKAPGSVPTARNTIVHELGHALEDDIGLKVTTWDETPYGQPPYVSQWAESGGSDRGAEDFAETFRTLVMEPGLLRKLAPEKYADMKARV